jgi:hypothetical protein
MLLAGIRRDRSTSPKFQLPTASPPPPLAPRPDLVQLPARLRRNFFNPERPSPETTARRLVVDNPLPLDLQLI